jgi:hypothetical protein
MALIGEDYKDVLDANQVGASGRRHLRFITIMRRSFAFIPRRAKFSIVALSVTATIPAMLRDLKGLLDDRIITEEDFLDKKRELLARL